MKEQIYREELIQLIWSTPWLLSILQTVRQCNPPDWLVGAGIIRNLVWDHLHQYQTPTALADIDAPERQRMQLRKQLSYLGHTWDLPLRN